MRKQRLLITGVSGLLGNSLASYFKDQYQVLGLYHQHPVTIAGIEVRGLDLGAAKDLKALVQSFTPDIVMHCAALADIDRCEIDHEAAIAANVTATANLVGALSPVKNVKLVYISTDSVYNGTRGNYTEEDAVDPPNFYAKTKLQGEEQALRLKGTLVARTAFFGFNVQDKMCFAERIPVDLQQGKTIEGFTDVITSAVYTLDLARMLKAALAKDLSGIYHFAASNASSKYDMAVLIARGMGYDPALIKPRSVQGFAFKARRGKDLSLSSAKLVRGLGPVVSMEETLSHFIQDLRCKT